MGSKNFTKLKKYTLNGLLMLTLLGSVQSQTWEQPYFIKIERSDSKINFTEPDLLSVEEEIARPFDLIKLNYKGGDAASDSDRPGISTFFAGNINLLKAQFEKREDGYWYITINNRQDYENVEQQLYVFDVYADKNTKEVHQLQIKLTNIFDNKPEVRYLGPNPFCSWKAAESDVDTNCTVYVRDIDGLTNNVITLSIEGDKNENEHFGFTLKQLPPNEYEQEYFIHIKKALDYDTSPWYTLKIRATDVVGNNGTGEASFSVINVPHSAPRWLKPLVTENFPEKQEQEFNVTAISGDVGIEIPVCYNLEMTEKDYSDILSIETVDNAIGVLKVGKIDRDARQQQIYKFEILAKKCDDDDPKFRSSSETVLIVDDINDNPPRITLEPNTIDLYENTTQSIELTVFDVNDIDLGDHAMYDVILESGGEAFAVVPSSGYQKASFQLTIKDKNYLDYENEAWRNIQVKIRTQDRNESSLFDEFTLNVALINWNDEPPTFVKSSYVVELNETVPKGYIIDTIEAEDRDVGDTVRYEILEKFYKIGINETTGVAYTLEDDIFDYDRQKVVFVQVQAADTLVTDYSDKLHTAYTQVTINVLDVNNKTPELRMPRNITNCIENTTFPEPVTDMIRATDPDTTADLQFKIDWDLTYATKMGKETVNRETFVNCFTLERFEVTNNEVYGHLKLNLFDNKSIVDYEEYDTMYLFIIVTDLNQEVNEGSASATLTIIINDINDCAPVFTFDTLLERRIILEEAMENSPAGNFISASDRDGPEFNIIEYSIRPINGTQDGWIKIDPNTGVLTVMENAKIDCDVPPIAGLYYEIELYDKLHRTTGNIMINITDINNKHPYFEEFEKTIEILENATSHTPITKILGHDDDRDVPHNVLEYSINFQVYKELQKFFQVDQLRGNVSVQLQDGFELDRDHGVTEHEITVDVKDNLNDPKGGPRNAKQVKVRVVLLDVNDNAPLMPKAEAFLPKISEEAHQNDGVEDKLVAEDIDQPNHENSWVSFKILSISKGEGCSPHVEDYEQLFRIEDSIEDKTNKEGKFIANKDLKSYYGTWRIHVLAYDHGEPYCCTRPDYCECTSNETFSLEVLPHNFHTPEIVFPTDKAIRLRQDQKPDEPLINYDNTKLQPIEANDPDGGVFGDVTFDIISDGDYFAVKHINRSHSDLVLKKPIDISKYQLNIRARDGGGQESSKRVLLYFVDMNGDPEFESNSFNTHFTENDKGLEEQQQMPEAKDPKNAGIENEDEKLKVYYYINQKFNPNDARFFKLDKETRILTLAEPLNRTATRELTIQVIATNSKEDDVTSFSDKSILNIKIKVRDSDPRPIFDDPSKMYGASITVSDYLGKQILKVHAEDSDIENSVTSYAMSSEIKTDGQNIDAIKNEIFKLDSTTGAFTLQKQIDSSMTGNFKFNITAEDNYGKKDEATVVVYILAEINRISYTFLSNYSLIKENENFIRDVLKEQYGYQKCNIDDISNSTKVSEDSTETQYVKVRVHFIVNNQPISGTDVLKKTTQQLTNNLKSEFISRQILLDGIENSKHSQVDKVEAATSTTLVVVAVILGVVCALLVVAFVLKTRALNRQLKAFAPPEFGSRASDLNRIGVPNTNVFSVEGSNPVINDNTIEEKFDDTSSIDSDGSDFVGINNDPNFMKNGSPTHSKNSSIISNYENRNIDNMIHKHSFENDDEKVMRF